MAPRTDNTNNDATTADADSALIASLFACSPKLVRSSVYPAPAEPAISVRSWKMTEHKYYTVPLPFPTLARGLFSRELPDAVTVGKAEGGSKKRHQILVRGYDKFFNIGEVPWTEWDAIEAHTAAPYNVTLKSNGCIIFIAALTPTALLITSKHSLGPVAGSPTSHAQAGEGWLRKYLAKVGRKEADLAAVLWEKNWTAIAELCDDNFEEHVLGYSPEKTGLHLHGLNVRTKDFITMPSDTVDAFAAEWGFIPTPHVTFNTIKEVRAFTTQCSEAGEWNGEPVEGFVVRTRVAQPSARSPYATGSSFFFKVKFDEPYMMYRDWREVTKILLNKKGAGPEALPRGKMKRPETKLYVKWVVQEIKRNPNAFSQYNKGKGIIATREKYLEYLKSDKGGHELQEAEKEAALTEGNFGKTIILPVAVPGCGKTAVSVALAHIFGFGHTQSDDVKAKKPAPIFIQNVVNLLKKHDVVIADKNNHLKQHREQLRTATADIDPPVRLLALNWGSDDMSPAEFHRICSSRIAARGTNHQALRADPTDPRAHEAVVWQFVHMTEPLSSEEVNTVVDMDVTDDIEAAVRRAVRACVDVLKLPPPSEKKIADALAAIEAYAPTTTRPAKATPKPKSARFYGLVPESNIRALLDARLAKPDVPPPMAALWGAIKAAKRCTDAPHITVVHRNSIAAERALWDRCAAVAALTKPPAFSARFTHVLCTKDVMALVVDGLTEAAPAGGGGQAGAEFVTHLPHDVRSRLHVTVGTRTAAVKAVEAKALVERWREHGAQAGTFVVALNPPVKITAALKGLNA